MASISNCFVKQCNSKDPTLSYHRLPSDPTVCQLWLDLIGRENIKCTPNTAVCSLHFAPDSYDSLLRLKSSALPTLFLKSKSPLAVQMGKCCVASCGKTSDEALLHQFPIKYPKLCDTWATIVGYKGPDAVESLRICDGHFKNRCRIYDDNGFVIGLTETSVPSIDLGYVDTVSIEHTYYLPLSGETNDEKTSEGTKTETDSEAATIQEATSDVCRLCFSKTNVRCVQMMTYKGFRLPLLLNLCLPFERPVEGFWPPYLCHDCIRDTIFTYEFLERCKTAFELPDGDSRFNKPLEEGEVRLELMKDEFEEADATEQTTETVIEDKSESLIDESCDTNESKLEELPDQLSDADEPNSELFTEVSMEAKEDKSYGCEFCEEIFDKAKDLRVHVLEVHIERLVCEGCGRQMKTSYGLSVHRKRCPGRQNHTCNECGKDLCSAQGLKLHVLRVHEGSKRERKYLCNLCGKRIVDAAALRSHMVVHNGVRPHTCKFCGAGFKYATSLTRHERLHENERPFKCDQCEKSFTAKLSMQVHVATVHEKKKKCKFCKQFFETRAEANEHSAQAHPNAKVTKYIYKQRPNVQRGPLKKNKVCETCGKCFATFIALREHSGIHTGEKMYSCKICDKRFRQSAHLYVHIAKHSNERRHVCPYCSKGFNYKSYLTTHIRRHTGDLPHVCTSCGKGFCDTTGLKRHKCFKRFDETKSPGTENEEIEEQTLDHEAIEEIEHEEIAERHEDIYQNEDEEEEEEEEEEEDDEIEYQLQLMEGTESQDEEIDEPQYV